MVDTLPIISLLDMDCFYVQVEARENPSIAGVPAAVVQYRTWKGGGIIAVNYEARAMGVSRQMRGDEAREKCPDIVLVRVPEVREKADLTKYRKAGREVIEVLLDSGAVVERASIDEAYLDLTKLVEKRLKDGEGVDPDKLPNTHLGGDDGDRSEVIMDWCKDVVEEGGDTLRLAIGAQIMEEVRAEVFRRTQFRCSAGISHCKTLAKLCCGLNKPNKQTVLPQDKIPNLYMNLPITKVRGLGGKLGHDVVSMMGVETMGQLSELSLQTLSSKLEMKTASWLHLLCKGRDGEKVQERELPKSIGCGKNFRGKEMLNTKEKVRLRMNNLVEELVERVEVDREEYNRIARGLTVGVGIEGEGHVTRAGQLHSYNTLVVFKEAMSLISRLNQAPSNSQEWSPPLVNLSISAGKFEEISGSTKSITSFFSPSTSSQLAPINRNFTQEAENDPESEQHHRNNDVPVLQQYGFVPVEPVPKEDDELQVQERGKVRKSPEASRTEQKSNKQVSPVSRTNIKSFFKQKALLLTAAGKDGVVTKNRDSEGCEETSDRTEEDVISDSSKVRTVEDDANPVITTTNNTILDVTNDVTDDVEDDICIDIAELIPSLSSFSPSLLSLLPLKLRQAAKDRVRLLKEKEDEGSGGSLSKYLTKGGGDAVNSEDLVPCKECSKMVSPFSLPEHLDYHYARSLARNCNEVGKRKREGDRFEDLRNKKRHSDISQFFSKK